MKEFRALRTVAVIFEVLAYINILLGAFTLILLTAVSNDYPMLKHFLASPFIIVVSALFSFVVCMAIANVIRLQIDKYNIAYENMEISKSILDALRSHPTAGGSMQSIDFKTWKVENPNKTINDYYAEK